MDSMTNLESEALKRKNRLQGLRQQVLQQKEQQADESNVVAPLPKPLFRSYKPLDEELQKSTLPAAKPESIDQQVINDLGQASETPVVEEIDLVNLAPRKPDWDLKRDVAKKLAKLDKRTQRAIAVLIRERLMETKQEDLASVVSVLN